MSTIELERLKAFVGFAEQICSHSGNGEDARRHINHLISRAEEDIKFNGGHFLLSLTLYYPTSPAMNNASDCGKTEGEG